MSILTEVVGQFLFSFTRGVTEHYNPEEPEFTAEAFGYDPLESTGREWYYQPVDELIYQEYSDREATTWDCLGSSGLDIEVINACSPDSGELRNGALQIWRGVVCFSGDFTFRINILNSISTPHKH